MSNQNYIFTSESVSEGHPDKIADQISDALVDAGLSAGDETTRVAVETLVTTNYVTLAGEVKNFNVSGDENSFKNILTNEIKSSDNKIYFDQKILLVSLKQNEKIHFVAK